MLTDAEIEDLLPQVPQWQVREVDGMKRLERTFKFKNFTQALEFTNKVGAIAEEEDHHPRIVTEWGRVNLAWWTQLIKGLQSFDTILTSPFPLLPIPPFRAFL